jgi:hypothetical protein
MQAVALATAVAAAGCRQAPSDYGAESEEVFLRSCVQNSGEGFADVCRCAYDRIVEEIPWDDFVEIDDALEADDSDLPVNVVRILTDCAADVGG